MTSGPRPYSAVVVDDEPDARQAVTTFLAEEPRVRVAGEASNGKAAVELIRSVRPSLVFLDVQMPDLDGFGVLAALGDDVPRGVVFVTAHDEHALRAFEVHALDYVLKPFGRPRFTAAVERALARLGAEEALASRGTLDALLRRRDSARSEAGELADPGGDATQRPRRLAVRLGSRIILVRTDEVDWVEADGDYVRVNADGAVHLVSSTLTALESVLPADRFCRIHRSVLVNLDRVRELHREPDGSGWVVLERDVRLRVSRGRWEELAQGLGVAD